MPTTQESYLNFYILETLLKNTRINGILIIQTSGIISSINNAFTRQFGYEPNDLIGKNVAVLFTEEDQKSGVPEKEIGKVLLTGQANDNNYLVNKNRGLTWVSGESVLVKNNEGKSIILKIVQNIHEQKTSAIANRDLNNFNERILSTINDVVIVLDNNLNIIKVNDAFLKLFNKQLPVITSLNLVSFLKQSKINKQFFNRLQNAINSKTGFSNHEIELTTADGNKRNFEITCTLLLDSDSQLLLTIHDITVYKELERGREDIIGFIMHELRNPLSSMLISNELMKEALQENDTLLINDLLVRSENNIKRMNKMIAGLYQSTKVNAGDFLLELSEFNFGDMVKEAIATVEFSESSVSISINGSGDFMVVADRYRIMQVITNYLSNAIKYSDTNKEINISIIHDTDTVTLSVKDHGMGIAKDHLPYVFDRFYRIKKIRNIEGIGLGLYLCNQIIKAHKGDVWVESIENKGSEFYFSIPLKHE
ncbi:MAG: PAS domain-containing sensor histidine kinase [Ginsengibacter sp.]